MLGYFLLFFLGCGFLIGAGLVWLVALTSWLRARARGLSEAQAYAGRTLVRVPAGVVLVGLCFVGWWQLSRTPSAFFMRSFGIKPPATIRNLTASVDEAMDSQDLTMRFQTNAATVETLLGPSFAPLSGAARQQFLRDNASSAQTDWGFKPNSQTQVWKPRKKRGNFSSEDKLTVFDPTTGRTYYSYSGID